MSETVQFLAKSAAFYKAITELYLFKTLTLTSGLKGLIKGKTKNQKIISNGNLNIS
jgi:hypothetical protein